MLDPNEAPPGDYAVHARNCCGGCKYVKETHRACMDLKVLCIENARKDKCDVIFKSLPPKEG